MKGGQENNSGSNHPTPAGGKCSVDQESGAHTTARQTGILFRRTDILGEKIKIRWTQKYCY